MENKSLGYFVDNNNIIIIRGYNYLVPLRILVLVSVMAFPSSNGGVYSFRFRTGIDGGGVKICPKIDVMDAMRQTQQIHVSYAFILGQHVGTQICTRMYASPSLYSTKRKTNPVDVLF